MTHLLRPALALLLTLALTVTTGCGRQDAAGGGNAASAPAAPAQTVLVVGTDAAYAPFESQDAQGRIVGFDIDIVQAVAARAGLQLRIVNTPWEGIFNALAQGDRDLVVSAVTITPERQATMDFSAPYFDARQLIAVRTGSAVDGFAALRGLVVGVQTGTTGDEAVGKLLGKTNPKIRRFESTPLALKELESGGVDAVVADNGVIAHHVANNPGGGFRTVADPAFVPERYGIAVRKGNTALLARIDQGLAAIKADGSHDAIQRRYFGDGANVGSASNAAPAPAPASAPPPAPASTRPSAPTR